MRCLPLRKYFFCRDEIDFHIKVISAEMDALPIELKLTVLGYVNSTTTLFGLKATCKAMNRVLGVTALEQLARSLATVNLRRLTGTFHLKFDTFCLALRQHCAILSGSAPLQALLGEMYSSSDLDIFIELDTLLWIDNLIIGSLAGDVERIRCIHALQAIMNTALVADATASLRADASSTESYYAQPRSDIVYVFTFDVTRPSNSPAVEKKAAVEKGFNSSSRPRRRTSRCPCSISHS